jgi:4'-phosphopantetheinyl transferase EntD
MIAALLPPVVAVVEAYTDEPGEPAFAGEEVLVANAVPARRREFVTARRCAREALARLGRPGVPIRSGPCREPLWPAGVVGSITHCAGYRAAAVAPAAELAGIGIDAEPHGPLPRDVLEMAALPAERELLGRLFDRRPSVHWDRLLYSAKESVYKAWYPLTGRWLGFLDARLRIEPAGSFTARVLVDGSRIDGGAPLTEVHGRYAVSGGLVRTAVSIAVDAAGTDRPDRRTP